jgi:uncharacterized integral membrane protein
MSPSSGGSAPVKKSGLSGRAIGGIVIAVVVVLFIASNRNEAPISFLFFGPWTMPLWLALALAAAGGLVAGFLIGRKRYKPGG